MYSYLLMHIPKLGTIRIMVDVSLKRMSKKRGFSLAEKVAGSEWMPSNWRLLSFSRGSTSVPNVIKIADGPGKE